MSQLNYSNSFMGDEKLTDLLQREKKCSFDEAVQVLELLGFSPADQNILISENLKKAAMDMWDVQFGQSTRNFGLSKEAFDNLVAKLCAGDQSLFEHVFLNHFKPCMQFLIHQKNIAGHIAYDAAMDTLIVFRQMLVDGKVGYGNLRYLFTRMAFFAACKMQQKNNRFDPLESAQGFPDTESEPVDEESVRILGIAWAKLTEECKQLLGGFYYQNQSWRDIAVALGVTEDNARKKGQRCRDALTGFVKMYV